MTTHPNKGEGKKGCFGSKFQGTVHRGSRNRVAFAMRKDEGCILLAFSFLGNPRPQPKE